MGEYDDIDNLFSAAASNWEGSRDEIIKVDPGQNLDPWVAIGMDRFEEILGSSLGRMASGYGSVAAQVGKYKIRTSPTEGDWSNFYRVNPRTGGYDPRVKESVRKQTGRVASGAMLKDFTHWIEHRANTVNIHVGWKNPDDYYVAQEYGFMWEHPDTDVTSWVPGVGAIEASNEELERIVPAIVERNMRKLGFK